MLDVFLNGIPRDGTYLHRCVSPVLSDRFTSTIISAVVALLTAVCEVWCTGESKDLFRPEDDGGNATTATIRGTPQYLSPILWKAHVVDGNSRFAKHNIYKSDVFSVGLLFY